jgi:H/ACA ribonucleoprotein complex subunit 4
MDRDVYEKKWKLGPFAKKKEDLKAANKLDKYGRMTDSTPEAWRLLFGDPEKATTVAAVAKQVGVSVPSKASAPAAGSDSEEEAPAKKRDDKKDKKEKKEKKEKKSKKDKKGKKDKKKKKDSSDSSSDSD